MSDNVISVRAGTSDTVIRTLKDGALDKDLTSVTRITLSVGGVTLDSALLGGVGAGEEFDTSEGSGKLVLRLGQIGTLPAAGMYADCVLTIYEPGYTAGQPWDPALLVRVIGSETFTSTYATKSSMLARFVFDELVQLTDLADTGEIDDLVLFEALQAADAEIDTYLGQRYALPLDNVPLNLERIACDIARYRLHRDGASESVRQRYTDARAFLRDVAKGAVQIGVNASQAAPTASALPDLHRKTAAQADAPGHRVFSMHDKDRGGFN